MSGININDPQSPFYLSASDSPGNIICPIILTGDNYPNWSRLVTNGLKSKNKLGKVDGTLAKPNADCPEGHAWERCNSMVIAWLHNVIDKSLHGSVAYAETAKELWSDLKDRYSQSNEIRIHQLKREITLANQGSQSVTEYFTKLKTLWDELGAYLALPNCSCTKELNLSKFFESERVHQFLMGLDTEQFSIVRSNLLAMEPLPTLNRAYAAVLREERQQALSKGPDGRTVVEGSAFKATTSMNRSTWSNNQPRPTGRPRCTHCHKTGHEREQCFELVGYPPNWGSRRGVRASQGGGRGNSKVWSSENGGQSPGVNKQRGGEALMAADLVGKKTREEGDAKEHQRRFGGLSPEIFIINATFLEELYISIKEKESQERMTGKSYAALSTQWILDSGASHHMTNNIYLIQN